MIASPLDPYLLSNEQEVSLLKAQDLLARDCLRGFGVATTRPVLPVVGVNTAMRERNKRTFVELKDAQRFGYHRSASFPLGRPGAEATQKPELPADAVVLLNGWRAGNGTAPKTYNGKHVPEYGCRGEAKIKLTLGVPVPGAMKQSDTVSVRSAQTYVASLRRQAIDQLLKDSRYHDVIKRWSACMKRSGHVYANPGAAMRDKRWKTPQPSRQEIDTAVGDTRCRLELNYLGIIGALRAAYEQRMVDRNAELLRAIRSYLDGVLHNADSVRGGRPAE
jgi:hypothetical protein